ncbi:hypothetical protein PR048_017924 [Dryococelus australis]|uniref:Cytochrome P450 n=1 Tax=Dryococelus australis TaxID=614101 RepID=A0ABQ9HAT6_9NEOP|nr:hypothetical protein PR048_017924 [Dryococelus australis]
MFYGAAVAERLACSPPTNTNRVQSPAGSLPGFRMGESCLAMPLVGGFSRGSPVSAALQFRRWSILTSITTNGSEDLGPPRLPLWGSHWFIFLANYRYTYKALAALGRYYNTNILGLHIGPFPAIVTLDYTGIKEVYDNPHCQGRLDGFLVRARAMGQRLGIFFTDGEQWKSQRRFMLKNMRDLGYARRSPVFEDVVGQEVQDLLDLINGDRNDEALVYSTPINDVQALQERIINACQHILDQPGVFQRSAFTDSCLRLPRAFAVGSANMLSYVIFGGRYPPAEHHKLYKLADMSCYAIREVSVTGETVAITPWLRHFGSRQFGMKGFVSGTNFVTNFFRAALEEHKATIDTSDENNLLDFMDFYLHKLKQNKSKGNEDFFQEDELLMMATDMMLPTISTMASLMSYVLLLLALHPEITARAQQSLDAAVGRDRLPTLDDRNRRVSC